MSREGWPVRCFECGAELPGAETCRDRFHALLAAEWDHPEAAAMHALFVFTYHAQHPSLCKSWLRVWQREVMREIYGQGRDWRAVLAWPRDRARRQEAVDRARSRHVGACGIPMVGEPIAGEATVADLPAPDSPRYPSEYPAAVEAWARSVAERRFL